MVGGPRWRAPILAQCAIDKRRQHLYLFDIEPWGPCQIDSNTSGKHGFGLPKLFRITSRVGSFAGSYTLRFKNRELDGFAVIEHSNSDLIRVAITQFAAWGGNHADDVEEELDTSLPGYTGEVSNRHGRVLSVTSLLPRDRGCGRERERNRDRERECGCDLNN